MPEPILLEGVIRGGVDDLLRGGTAGGIDINRPQHLADEGDYLRRRIPFRIPRILTPRTGEARPWAAP